jgi:hypothetical protein
MDIVGVPAAPSGVSKVNCMTTLSEFRVAQATAGALMLDVLLRTLVRSTMYGGGF